MSELRIALISEGPTDLEVIQGALKAILTVPFVLNQLQPEATRPKMGGGWCGVLKWCREARQLHNGGSLEEDPVLQGFDMVIVHLDLDVALFQYADCGPTIANSSMEQNWGTLPCAWPCPPVSHSVEQLQNVLRSWLHPVTTRERTLICLPAQSSGSWLAAAALPTGHPLLNDIECDVSVESRLGQLPREQRIRKKVREYREHAPKVTQSWEQVKAYCSQARRFEQDLIDTGLVQSPQQGYSDA